MGANYDANSGGSGISRKKVSAGRVAEAKFDPDWGRGLTDLA